jgi:gluconokinase
VGTGTGAPARVVIGLDAGTTSVKAAAFGVGSAWSALASREYPLLQPAPGQQVQDPAAVLRAAGEALAECVAAARPAEVVAVSVSAGMHGLVAFDEDRRPITPLVTWADARARDEARELHRGGLAADLHTRTGVPVHPMSPLAKLLWFARHDRATWERARWWGGLKDLLLHWLTGSLVTELSSASGTGLLDVGTCAWSPEALDACGLDADRLTPVESPTATLPLAAGVATQVGLPAGTPVVAGAADGPLGNVGTGALGPGVAGLSLGTSGAIRTAVDGPRIDPGHRLFCYALTESVWVVGGAISNGGSAARWAREAIAPDVAASAGDEGPDEAALAVAATAPPGCDGLVMLPYLLAERAPLWDPDLSGAYLGLRRDHGREHLLRAAVEGVCLQMRLILDDLDAVAPVTAVRATGGAFRSRLWQEVMAAALGRPIVVGDSADGTARGAAALGLVGVGLAPTLDDAVRRLDEGRAEPTPVEPDRELVAAYDRLRASVPGLIAQLAPVAALFAGPQP